jgi:hypothetical protein
MERASAHGIVVRVVDQSHPAKSASVTIEDAWGMKSAGLLSRTTYARFPRV